MGAALLFGQKTAGFTEKSALKNCPTIWPDGLMSYTSPKRPAGRPGSSTEALLGLAQNKGRSTEKSSLKRKSHDLAPRVNTAGDAVETRQCAEINRRAPAVGPKCGVDELGCGNLAADDF